MIGLSYVVRREMMLTNPLPCSYIGLEPPYLEGTTCWALLCQVVPAERDSFCPYRAGAGQGAHPVNPSDNEVLTWVAPTATTPEPQVTVPGRGVRFEKCRSPELVSVLVP